MTLPAFSSLLLNKKQSNTAPTRTNYQPEARIICSMWFVWPYARLLTALHYMWCTSRLPHWTGYRLTHTWEGIRSPAVVTLVTQSFAKLDSLHNCFTMPVSWVSSGIMGQGLSFVYLSLHRLYLHFRIDFSFLSSWTFDPLCESAHSWRSQMQADRPAWATVHGSVSIVTIRSFEFLHFYIFTFLFSHQMYQFLPIYCYAVLWCVNGYYYIIIWRHNWCDGSLLQFLTHHINININIHNIF